MDVFISQLLLQDSALLAAYALATCLKYGEWKSFTVGLMQLTITLDDMKESIRDSEDLPKHIVGMLRLDYFDDAVGQVEGFQIFGDLMQHGDNYYCHS